MKAQSALMAIPTPADRDKWLKISTAYKAAGGDYETWDNWCRQGEGYNAAANAATWKSIKAAGGITEATLYKAAAACGWINTDRAERPHQLHDPAAPRRPAPINKSNAIAEYIRAAADHAAEAAAYLAARGINADTAARFNLGYDTTEKRLVIPYPQADYYVSRNTTTPPNGEKGATPKYKYPAKAEAGEKPLFNIPALNSGAEIVFITEGQIDAITLCQYGAQAIAATEPETILQALDTYGTTATAFLYAADNDDAGQGKGAAVVSALTATGRTVYAYPLPAEYHDINDYQIRAAADLAEWIRNAPNYIETQKRAALDAYNAISGAGRFQDFLQSIHAQKPAIPTGYPTLDLVLGDGLYYRGGLYAGLYIIGGISSIGKTTFFMQMADQIAQGAGADCIIFSLEMSARELIAKSISRLTAAGENEDLRKTTRGILQGNRYARYSAQELRTIEAAENFYQQYARHLYIVEGQGEIGVEDIRAQVKRHKEITGNTPLVFIDYLQILAPYDAKSTDKQNTDKAVLELKRISRDYETPIIAISSFNRENYSAQVSLASFKESGAIEYSSDVLIGLQLQGAGTKNFNADEEKQRNPRQIEMKILKNRNGASGAVVHFEYTPQYNLYYDTAQGHIIPPQEAADISGITSILGAKSK